MIFTIPDFNEKTRFKRLILIDFFTRFVCFYVHILNNSKAIKSNVIKFLFSYIKCKYLTSDFTGRDFLKSFLVQISQADSIRKALKFIVAK